MSDYVPTGIPGVDAILGGVGIPQGHTVLISGGPWQWKKHFRYQFLHQGVTEHGEPGVYITLDEEPEDVKKNMSQFGCDLDELEREKKLVFINVSPVRVASTERAGLIQLGMKEFKLVKLLEAVRAGVEEVQARRVVILHLLREKENCETFGVETGEPSCLFTTGFLNGLFSAVKNQRVIAAGDAYCEWEVG